MSSTDAPAPALADLTGDYEFDPAHSRLGFVARHAMVTKVRGSFTAFTGKVHIDAQDPTRSTAEVTAEVASVATGQEQRDQHLHTNDFFDAGTYPQITFRSTAVEVVDAENYRVTGDLTIKDVTRPVTVDLEYGGSSKDPFGNQRVGFEGRGEVNRKDWGLTYNAALETGGFLIGEKIKLEFDISLIRLVSEAG